MSMGKVSSCGVVDFFAHATAATPAGRGLGAGVRARQRPSSTRSIPNAANITPARKKSTKRTTDYTDDTDKTRRERVEPGRHTVLRLG
jgi:hypothetical protein